ncbi:MAG: hypothetical protein CM1200mP2_08010 [Planctomycetaceae bacterium]|nr:MAG: hypothetical protein CM1200mP2_08010 [Planctomycetaceae bacterium]
MAILAIVTVTGLPVSARKFFETMVDLVTVCDQSPGTVYANTIPCTDLSSWTLSIIASTRPVSGGMITPVIGTNANFASDPTSPNDEPPADHHLGRLP